MKRKPAANDSLLSLARIDATKLGTFIRAAVKRNDAAALVAAKAALGRVVGSGLDRVLFELALAAKPEHREVGIALQELAMAVKGASREAHNNALFFLTSLPRDDNFEADVARRWLERVVKLAPVETAIFHNAADIYLRLGDHERAMQMVAGAVLYGFDEMEHLKADRALAPLRADRRYKTLFDPETSTDKIRRIFEGPRPERAHERARNTELEAAILADRHAIEPYLVYGDWLQEREDPRGELIAIQHARTKAPRDHKLQRREAAFLAQHAGELLGTTSNTRSHDGDQAMSLVWHLGFVRSARFKYVSYQAKDRHVPDLEVLVRDFLRCDSAKFLEELYLGVVEPDDSYAAVIKAVIAARPATLRKLHLAERTHAESELSWVELGNLGKLWRGLPGLRELIIEGGKFELGELDLPNVRAVEIRTSGLSQRNLERISSARWPHLERLQVWFGSQEYGARAKVTDLEAILSGARLSKVTYLGLMNAEFTDALADILPRAKILRQLKVLDLSMGTLTHAGLEILLAHAKSFAHLDVLDLSMNHLTGSLAPQVKRLAKRVILDRQRAVLDLEDDGRYVAIGG